jgi:hypothetical protein
MVMYTPRAEIITGANLTGSDGAANRTYELANDNAVLAQMQVIRASAILQSGVDFTFSTVTNTITFLTNVWDDQPIALDYLTTEAVVSGDYYTNTLQITRYAGIGIEVFNENLGTGNNSETDYELNKGNVIAGSYTLKHAAADSNSFTTMTDTTHYTLSKDGGTIVLTSAGVTELGTDVLYMDYVYTPKHSDTLLETYLPAATREAEKNTRNYWGTAKTSIQFFDGYDSGYPQTDKPFGFQIDPIREFELDVKGINSITSIIYLDRQGNEDRTLDTTEYRIITEDDGQEDGRIMINTNVPNGKANVKVTFVHGYDSVPDQVQELTALIGGVMVLVNISGGSYKDVATYTLGRKTFSVGEVYINVREVILQLTARIDKITADLGDRFACV